MYGPWNKWSKLIPHEDDNEFKGNKGASPKSKLKLVKTVEDITEFGEDNINHLPRNNVNPTYSNLNGRATHKDKRKALANDKMHPPTQQKTETHSKPCHLEEHCR